MYRCLAPDEGGGIAGSIDAMGRRRNEEDDDDDAFGSAGSQFSSDEEVEKKQKDATGDKQDEEHKEAQEKGKNEDPKEVKVDRAEQKEEEEEEARGKASKEADADEELPAQPAEEYLDAESDESEWTWKPRSKEKWEKKTDKVERTERTERNRGPENVPRDNRYFLHDERQEVKEEGEKKEEEPKQKGKREDKDKESKEPTADDDGKWPHDKYYELLEEKPRAKAPKSTVNPQDDDAEDDWAAAADWRTLGDYFKSATWTDGRRGKGKGRNSRGSRSSDWNDNNWWEDDNSSWSKWDSKKTSQSWDWEKPRERKVAYWT